jgi:hypothetical protein
MVNRIKTEIDAVLRASPEEITELSNLYDEVKALEAKKKKTKREEDRMFEARLHLQSPLLPLAPCLPHDC